MAQIALPGLAENCRSTPARRAASAASVVALLRIGGDWRERGSCRPGPVRAAARHRRPRRSFPPARRRRPARFHEFGDRQVAAGRGRTSSASRTGKATRRETTSGDPAAKAPRVWLRASWAWTRSWRRESRAVRARLQRLHAQPPLGAAVKSGAPCARQQRGFHARRGQPFDQPQHLPLAAAHFLAGVQVQDAHQLMFLALAYFRKV